MRAALSAATIALVATGCDDRPRPWARGDGPPAVLSPRSAGETGRSSESSPAEEPPESAEPSATPASAPVATPSGTSAEPAPEPLGEGPPSRVTPGGLWAKCYEGVALSGDVLRDVTRLGLSCGPSNGMRRKTRQAIVGLVGQNEPPVTVTLRASRAACYRVLAVADAQVGDLNVTVRSSRDVGVAADHSAGRLAIVQPDRPFCALADDTYTIEISAGRGAGRFAAEVWAIGEPKRRRDPLDSPADEPDLDSPD